MGKFGWPHTLVIAVIVVAVSYVALPEGSTGTAPPATRVYDEAACGRVRDVPQDHAPADVNAMVVCLLNFERVRHGVAPLTEVATLDIASQRHSDDMVARHFFEHDTPEGVPPEERILGAGYRGERGGENIGWGEGTLGTPAEIVDAWMHSQGHRENILDPGFTGVGVGLRIGQPPRGKPTSALSATYTTDFGG